MAAWSAIQLQLDFNVRYARLQASGTRAKIGFVACMRVLVVPFNAMVRQQIHWKTTGLTINCSC